MENKKQTDETNEIMDRIQNAVISEEKKTLLTKFDNDAKFRIKVRSLLYKEEIKKLLS